MEDLAQPLDEVAGNLEDTGWAAEVCDADWRLVYVTSQLRYILGTKDDAELAIGRHILEVRGTPFWQSIIEPDRSGHWPAENVPQMLADDPSVRDRLLAMVKPDLQPIVEAAEPAPVTRGRLTHFERMARLVEPGRREAAILFADVEASSKLSRRLNECARIEQTAAGGALLASKALIERLDPDDAAAVAIDPSRMVHRALGNLDGADEKAIRDAGLIAVTRLDPPLAS